MRVLRIIKRGYITHSSVFAQFKIFLSQKPSMAFRDILFYMSNAFDNATDDSFGFIHAHSHDRFCCVSVVSIAA